MVFFNCNFSRIQSHLEVTRPFNQGIMKHHNPYMSSMGHHTGIGLRCYLDARPLHHRVVHKTLDKAHNGILDQPSLTFFRWSHKTFYPSMKGTHPFLQAFRRNFENDRELCHRHRFLLKRWLQRHLWAAPLRLAGRRFCKSALRN